MKMSSIIFSQKKWEKNLAQLVSTAHHVKFWSFDGKVEKVAVGYQ